MQRRAILIVDDEPLVLGVTRAILTASGYDVVTAANAKEALQVCEEMNDKLFLVLSDVSMPGMNGIDLAECISKSHRNIPIILMSGFSETTQIVEEMRRGRKACESSFLRKPFRPKDLIQAIQTAVQITATSPSVA